MSSRPILTPFQVLKASMAANATSIPTIIQNLSMLSYDISWTGTTPVGAISVQVSNSYTQNGAGVQQNAGNWTTITFSYNGTQVSSIPITGNTGNGFIDIEATGAYAMRLVYTATSGTGTITALASGKVA